jgi:hypothetical protein
MFQVMKSSLVTQGRQLCVSGFMGTKATHLLFIDSDISFNFRMFERMLLADKDIILTPYPVKTFDVKKAKDLMDRGNKLDLGLLGNQYTLTFKDDPTHIQIENGIVELTRGPAGFMLIKKEVFTKLIEKYPNFIIKQHTLVNGGLIEDDSLYNFFDTFFNGGAALGGFILVDPLLIITVEFIHLHSDGLKTFQAQSHTIVYAANEFSFEGFGLVGI